MSAEKSWSKRFAQVWDQLQYASDLSHRHQSRSPDSAWRKTMRPDLSAVQHSVQNLAVFPYALFYLSLLSFEHVVFSSICFVSLAADITSTLYNI